MPTVEEIIAERIEKAAECLMIAEIQKAQGGEEASIAWELSAEYAQATADHLTRLTAENKRYKHHLDNESEHIGSCEQCSTRIYDGDECSTSIDGCYFCFDHSAMLSDCLAQMEQHLVEAGDEAYVQYECVDQAEFLADIASLKARIAEDGDSSTAST